MDIKGKARGSSSDADFVGPTPNNTPVQPAPIATRVVSEQPSVGGILEEVEDDETMEMGTTSETAGAAANLSDLSGNLFAGNQRLVNMLQGKLGTLLGRSSGYVESLPAPIRRRVDGLKYLQMKHTELECEFHKEILELEKKYLELYRPLYDRRAEIIEGTVEPTEAEVEAGKSDTEEDAEAEAEETPKAEETDASVEAGIPEFWLTALKNHGALCELITEADEDPLRSLRNIRIQYTDDKPGFMLLFDFDENDFFTNKILTKTYYYQQSSSFGDLVYESSKGCDIEWKESKDLTVTIETKKQRHKTTNKTRVIKRAVPNETFFTFFSTIQASYPEGELDVEQQEELDERLEVDYELGEEFKEKLVPRAVDWFTGKALEYENVDVDDEYEDEEDLYYGGTTDEDDEDDSDDGY